MGRTGWTGRTVTQARKALRAQGQVQQCSRCGQPVDLDREPWDADHLTEMVHGGTNDPSNLAVAHRRCNQAAGGRIGGRRTAANLRATTERATGTRRW